MKRAIRVVAFVLAIAFLVLTFINASWIAPTPRGPVKLIAHRGAHQIALPGDSACEASRIEQPWHAFLENTLPSLDQASRSGAQMVEADIVVTKDGRIAMFGDATLDCRTDGTGSVSQHTLEELKALDAGHGYTADGGKTFPFRGKGVGAIPSLEEYVAAAGTKPLIYNFKSKDAQEADQLAAALKATGRDVAAAGDAFYGAAGPVRRIREIYPDAWAFTKDEAKACTTAYLKLGWLGITPNECEGGTLFIPVNRQWLFAGWPNRLIERMEAVGARTVLVGPHGEDHAPMGLTMPEQVGDIPVNFNGWVWVDDIQAVGPALRPSLNRRRPIEEEALAKTLEARRKAAE
jgi:glycerophosphoryl diester phosphodiesterase